MTPIRGLIQSVKGWIGKPIAGPDTDPAGVFGNLLALPNPDPILRAMGQAERVYASIGADPHVLGDIRSIRGNFRSHAYRVLAGDPTSGPSLQARDLVIDWLQRSRPSELCDWLEVMWQMSASFLTGYRPHELVWGLTDGRLLPEQVVDRPGRRMRFDAFGSPLLISRGSPTGAPIEPFQFVVSRHMPTAVNPYGVAVLSSCFWAWMFKTGGWRAFVKYCERHGLPWPVGRYAPGATPTEQDQLAEALANMIDAGYVIAPDGTGLELLTPTSSGSQLPQQALIDLCNREMSKAITGQAMVAELQGVGARAASETALKRQESIDDSVRDIAAQSMGQIARWITLLNLGDGVAPPILEFYRQEAAGKERAETYEIAHRLGARPSRRAMLEELGMPEADGDDDQLGTPSPHPVGTSIGAPAAVSTLPGTEPARDAAAAEFAAAPVVDVPTESEAERLTIEAADAAIEHGLIAPIARMLERYEADGRTLAEFQADLAQLVDVMDASELQGVVDQAMSLATLQGATSMEDERA